VIHEIFLSVLSVVTAMVLLLDVGWVERFSLSGPSRKSDAVRSTGFQPVVMSEIAWVLEAAGWKPELRRAVKKVFGRLPARE